MSDVTLQGRCHTMLVAWLALVSVMVFTMVVLGGAVRLTGSGLSIVEWAPLLGVVPPLDHAAWQEVFGRYQQYPQYQLVNSGMSLDAFKFIYYMEYFHRLLGRLVGLVFFIPFMFFLFRCALPGWLKKGLWFALALGAAQGLMGWFMVMSGLVDDPHVSQYRLTAHLLLAVFILTWLLILLFRLLYRVPTFTAFAETIGSLRRSGSALLLLILLMIASGGMVAGTRAGFIYNSWPKMGAEWMPEQVWAMLPWWRNLLENPMAIQFVHRWLAVIVLLSVVAYAIAVIRRLAGSWSTMMGLALIGCVTLQVGLGIITLLHRVPLSLGVAHQGVAMLLLTLVVATWSGLRAAERNGFRDGSDR